jgi:coenzyme F420-dependent glucose-6-phosphate dehydrogenase
MRVGYHCSHEQYPPSELLAHARAAEAAGFEAAMCSDHFHPWTEAQGHSGYAWSWLGAALEATRLSFGTVSAPGWRYHPAVLAQAAATLAEMYPERLWLAVGSGEALNEAITAEPWPAKPERTARLRECVDVMRALWRGEEVTHLGRVRVQEARLYSRPARAPLVFGAALSEETAEAVGGFCDGLATVGAPPARLRRMIDAFRRGGGEGKPVYVQHALSWAPTEAEAHAAGHAQWAFAALGGDVLPTLRTPREFAAAARFVTPDDLGERIRVSADLGRHAAWIAEYAALGVDAVYLFNVNRGQRAFVEAFGKDVLPRLAGSA